MKIFGSLDLAVQTLIIVPVVMIFLFYAFTGHIESAGTLAMLGALFLGPWQLISSLSTTISKRPFLKWRRIHLIGSASYFAVLVLVLLVFQDIVVRGVLEAALMTYMFGVPIVLALFYYYITFMTVNRPKQ